MIVQTLSIPECMALLAKNRLARLACAKDGQPYLVPIYYAYADRHLYAFSMPGKKIDWMRGNPLVSVQIDEQGKGRGWKSVVIDGRYEELPDRVGQKVERDHAWRILSRHANWWEPGALKPATLPVSDHSPHVFFRIAVEQLSGRGVTE
ncbi:pyridoxamine 5'-phosphate oxidase family protein [Mesorhizobium sp.]|uniref:pyridoxamine 5'-phosphate oxidase family protein n=1 Tax=Mesorhizobium sp. TaxID=1871066 RepID=UPI000FE6ED9F|nr:pyridoxamine 5'-phosphate oxidase family protein [Mesorhizobium sp.]RWP16325.1 MAG: pyridoxamine 5'-phosphate oxidase family protein [Mesorhizobium sp.]RWQ26034.1 MAG: pyridoxamine 5'-phosphate oxidase family protein [Mesorhizobium sp.]